MARDVDPRKFLSGYLLTFAGGLVSWQSRLQQCVALSATKVEYIAITEVEYIAITEGCKETLLMKNFLQELGVKEDIFVVYCESQSVVDFAKEFDIPFEI